VVVTTNALATRVFLDCDGPSASPVAAGGTNLRVQVPADRDCKLRVEADGFQSVSLPIRLGAGEETGLPVLLAPVALAPTRRPAGHTTPRTPPPVLSNKNAELKKDGDGEFINPF
jgi:hypothetical protein